DYVLLRAGGALGKGVGPLLVAKDPDLDLAGKRVAIPGGLTTANLLLKLWRDDLELVAMRYDRIMAAVAAREVDAGLIIHESRFTYREHGLTSLVDLGSWWQDEVGQLVPLGAIVAKRSLGPAVHARLTQVIRASLRYAFEHPAASAAYVATNAQEMSAEVRGQHIALYVNDYSLDVGTAGEAAVRELLGRAVARGLFEPVAEPLFAGAAGKRLEPLPSTESPAADALP
ncbi:MAG TPA: MqnA/MqnD/SBP family protein, partial [Trueperaceae bacterium]|nr:MqnA/MqnD/SBP family protein [Trueperaceae bacterium]